MNTINVPAGTIVKPCPCCGSAPDVCRVKIYGSPSTRICCGKCGLGTAPVTEGTYMQYRGRKNVTFTLEETITEALVVWNARHEAETSA